MKRIVITSGEPAGIGPDICTQLNWKAFREHQLIFIGDADLLKHRAHKLHVTLPIRVIEDIQQIPSEQGKGLFLLNQPCQHVRIGRVSVDNSAYVINQIILAARLCLNREVDAMVTAPVHKAILNEYLSTHDPISNDLNQYGFNEIPRFFLGHTEFLQTLVGVDQVVMLLTSDKVNVALVTTHVAVKDIASHLNYQGLIGALTIIDGHFHKYFKPQSKPKIAVLALNPHAGEGGHLGNEEITLISPAIEQFKADIDVTGPISADTAFSQSNINNYDVFVGMYHDQVLPTFKHIAFQHSANVTLGLPFIRTSVDHGTALEIAGTSKACPNSLNYAVTTALKMSNQHQIRVS